jgi:carbon storage regulator
MLVLSRNVGESLVIDNGVVVRVLVVTGGRVRLGIEAPAEVSVRRSELASTPRREIPPLVICGRNC